MFIPRFTVKSQSIIFYFLSDSAFGDAQFINFNILNAF